MSIEQEQDTGIPSLPEQTRDLDIRVLSSISSLIDFKAGVCFVLTGSYAVEAVTGYQFNHEDVDTNIFTTNLKDDLSGVANLISELSIPEVKLRLFKGTEDRLEYDFVLEQANSRRLEIQFVEVLNTTQSSGDFNLKSGGTIPTVKVPIKDSKNQEFLFRVKSLPYSIAAWVIRISGSAMNPKRSIKESDLTHLKLLMSVGFEEQDVLAAMNHHPQMPMGETTIEVFSEAIKKLT